MIQAFTRMDNKWELTTDAPWFKVEAERVRKGILRKTQHAEPRAVWAAKFPRGAQDFLQDILKTVVR